MIVLEPAFGSYGPAIELAGGRPVYVALNPAQDFAPDWDHVRALEQIASETCILLLSDEVYEHIIFDNREHQSLARSPLLDAQAIVVSSFGKSLRITG